MVAGVAGHLDDPSRTAGVATAGEVVLVDEGL